MANRPVVSNLDFADIKKDIIDYFKGKPEFSDYEFTGSALNMLVEILAYNTHYNALSANLLLNEMFLDSANVRSSVTSIAKMLNYTPRSMTAASTTITLNVPKLTTESLYVIPAGTQFSAKSGNSSANFYTIEDYSVQFESTDLAKSINVIAHEGRITSQRFVVSDISRGYVTFNLNSQKVDTQQLVVSVNGVKWLQVDPEDEGITETTGNSHVFFVEENRDGSFSIIFGNGSIGKALDIGDEIIATYIDTNGETGNGISTFNVTVEGRPDITVTSASVSQGGASKESVNEIKQNAPHWYQSQYRAVTENDYEALFKKKYADIQSIKVYGGEKVNRPGKVFIAIRPKSSDTLSDSTKVTLINDVIKESNVITVKPEIVDPFYVDLILKTIVTFDDNLLVTNRETLKAKVKTYFDVLNNTYLEGFSSSFSESATSKDAFDLDDSITSVNTRVSLRTTINASNTIFDTYGWSFGNKLYHPEDGYKASTGGILKTSLFGLAGDSDLYGLDDDGIGNIRMYRFEDNQKIYTNFNAGTLDYDSGQITLSSTIYPDDGSIDFTVIPDSFDVLADNNTILRISVDSSFVEAIEKQEKAILKSNNVSRSA